MNMTVNFEAEIERQRVAEVSARGRLDEPELLPFKLVVWKPSTGRMESVVYAKSYDSAHYEFITMAMFGPSVIAGVEPLD